MIFGQNQDPRYRGNSRVLLTLVCSGVLAAGLLVAMFWIRDRRGASPAPAPKVAVVKPAAPVVETSPTPAVPTPSPEEVAKREKLQELRAKLTASRDWDVVAGVAQEILAIEPADGQAWTFIGQSREAKGDPKGAMEAYEHAIVAPSPSYYSYFLRGRLQRAQGDLPAALASLEEARRLKTDSIVLSNLIMIFKLQAGQIDDVRSQVRVYQQSELHSNVDQWLFGAAALALQDGNEEKAVSFSNRFRNLVNPEIYKILVSDAFFDAYRQKFPAFFSDLPGN